MSSNSTIPFFRCARATPERVALRIGGEDISYGALAALAGRLARRLRAEVAPPARVGVLASRSLEAYAAVLGACAAGLTWVPLSPDQPEERLLSLIARAKLDALVADRPLSPRVAAAAPRLVLGRAELAALDGPPLEPAPPAPGAIAYVMFTSGTTGAPKGVEVGAAALAHYLRCMRARWPIRADDRVSQFFDLGFDLSVHDVFMALGAGATLCVVPRGELLAPARFIRDERLTVWFSVPSVVALLRKARLLRPGAFPALRLSSFCGEPLPLASIEAWRAAAPASAIENQYGPTEATISCTAERWSDGAPAVTEGRGTVAIGRPYEGTLAGIVDEALRFVAPGTPGELVLAGPQLAAGYLDDPELTARRFPTLAHPRHGEGRWYRTGDLAVEDEGGRLHHLGRIDHQVKILGKRVELEDIEANLRAACGTASVAAVAWPVEAGVAQGVVAFVAAGERDEEVVKSRMRARVPAHMVPRRVVPVGDLPLTANGKLDRKLLVALLDAGAAAGRAPANGGVEREAA